MGLEGVVDRNHPPHAPLAQPHLIRDRVRVRDRARARYAHAPLAQPHLVGAGWVVP